MNPDSERFSRPYGAGLGLGATSPALKRRATFGRPFGTWGRSGFRWKTPVDSGFVVPTVRKSRSVAQPRFIRYQYFKSNRLIRGPWFPDFEGRKRWRTLSVRLTRSKAPHRQYAPPGAWGPPNGFSPDFHPHSPIVVMVLLSVGPRRGCAGVWVCRRISARGGAP